MGLKPDSKSVNSPGTGIKYEELEDDEPLNPQERTCYRQIVARGNYISQDRCDIQYAVKELSRGMSSPKASDMRALKSFGRYLVGRTRYVIRYNRQRRVQGISTQVDTDHAGCLRTRKSTSVGVLKLGNHVIKTWAHTQSVIALSSGEAEYYGMVKGASYS